MKIFVSFVLTAGLFYFFGTQSGDPIKSQNKSAECPIIQNGDVEEIAYNDLLNRYENSKKVVPMLFLSFLASIGIRLSQNEEEEIQKELSENPENFQKILDSQSDRINELIKEKFAPQENAIAGAQTPQEKLRQKKLENSLERSRSSFQKVYEKSSPVKRFKKNESTTGRFEGTIEYRAGKYQGETHTLMLEFKFAENEDFLEGEYSIQLIRDGFAYNTKNGSGKNKEIKRHSSGSLIFEVSPDSYLLFRNSNPLSSTESRGRYISKNQHVGDAILRRQ